MSNAYFDALVDRADYWKSLSLREPWQLLPKTQGGYSQPILHGNPTALTVDPVMDATRVTVRPWYHTSDTAMLASAVSATETILTLVTGNKPNYPDGRELRLDQEICTVVEWIAEGVVEVLRGVNSTSATAHASGTWVYHATNSIRNQLRFPLGTTDGHRYFFTFDIYWTASFQNSSVKYNHKAIQFSSGSRDGDGLWFELDATYGPDGDASWNPVTDVSTFHTRGANLVGGVAPWTVAQGKYFGPGVTRQTPVGKPNKPGDPDLWEPYTIRPNQWTRFSVLLDQRPNDWDPVTVWVADESRDAMEVLSAAPLSVLQSGPTPNSVSHLWIEFNSSEDSLTVGPDRDRIVFVRNFVALIDPPMDLSPLLLRPEGGVPVPPHLVPATDVRMVV